MTGYRAAMFAATVALATASSLAYGDDWPQYRGPRRDGVWRETGIVEKLPPAPRYRWRTPVGPGFVGPAVAANRVYLCDRVLQGKDQELYRWDRKDPTDGVERVLCLAADSGAILWKYEYPCRYAISFPSGPRATPTVDEGRVYTLGAMGDLLCLDAQTGRLLWSKNYVRDFGTRINPWGMAAAPLIDGRKLIVIAGGKDGAAVLALDKLTGAEIWRALDCPDPGYSAPVIIECAGVRQLLAWLPIGLCSLDPESGKLLWREPAELKMAHSIASPIFDPERRLALATSFFEGSLMVRLEEKQGKPSASLLWKGGSRSELPQNTEGLHGLMSTPAFYKGRLYGVCSYGQLRCLDPQTGARIWETCAATGEGRWSTAFLVRCDDRFFLFNEQGELIVARLSPERYEELGRMRILTPTTKSGRRTVVWSHPAFAQRAVFARNDQEIVCVDLAAR